jgi:hypothetical protein
MVLGESNVSSDIDLDARTGGYEGHHERDEG